MIPINGQALDEDTAIRRISDMWADEAGAWRPEDYFDLISKFLQEKNLANVYVMFVEDEIEKLSKYNDGEENND